MSFTKAFSNNLYHFLDQQGVVSEPDKIRYGVDFLSASVTKIAVVLAVGTVTGTLKEVTVCMLSFGLLRQYSGGAHMGNSKICLFVMLGIYYSIITLSYYFSMPQAALYGLLIFEAAMIYIYAPADTANHPIVGSKHRKRLRIKSFLVYCIGVLFAVWFKDYTELLVLSFFVQAVTLTPFAYKLTNTKKKEVTYHA